MILGVVDQLLFACSNLALQFTDALEQKVTCRTARLRFSLKVIENEGVSDGINDLRRDLGVEMFVANLDDTGITKLFNGKTALKSSDKRSDPINLNQILP